MPSSTKEALQPLPAARMRSSSRSVSAKGTHDIHRCRESVRIAPEANVLAPDDVRLLTHRINLRIMEMVQKRLGLGDYQVPNTVQRRVTRHPPRSQSRCGRALAPSRLARSDVASV